MMLGIALTLEIFSAGETAVFAEEQPAAEVLQDSGGDLLQTDSSGAQTEVVIEAADASETTDLTENPETIISAETETGAEETDQVMPEEIGESIKEIIQASADLAQADDAGLERLESYIEETKDQYEALPEEGQAVLQESIQALDNAAVAVETCQDAARQMKETGTIQIDPNGQENSFRFLNGMPIDESLIAVEEEIQTAAELNPEDLYPEAAAAGNSEEQGNPSQTETDGNLNPDSSQAVDPSGSSQSVIPEEEITDDPAADSSDGSQDAQSASDDQNGIPAEPEQSGSGGSQSIDQNGSDASLDVQNGSDGAETTEGGTAGTDTANPDVQGTADAVSAGNLKAKELPKADVAVVKTAAGQRLVNLDGSSEVQNILTASSEVHKGIDVSHHNGSIDWDQVKQAGIEFAIIRCGHGHNLETGGDAYWLRNISEVERVGMPYGIYFYSYATSVAGVKKEAATTIKLLKGHKPSLPVFYDMEDVTQKSLSTNLKNKMAAAYCDDVTAAGYQAGLYSYKYWLEGYMSPFINSTDYPIWVAQYASKTTYTGDYIMWQYSSSGRVNGIPGRVDMNYWYGKLKAVRRKATPQVVVDVLNSRVNLQFDTRIAQTTSKELYTQKQVSPGNWIIVKNATETEPEKQLYGFVYIPSLSKICYFDPATGYKVFGQRQINGKWYLFEETGGAMQVGFQYLEAQGKIVYYNAQGQMQFGKQFLEGHWHYFNPGTGAMRCNSFLKLTAKKKCYYDDYGRAVSGEKKIGKYYYYFNPKTFAMKTGIVKVAGKKKTCYYNKKGHRKTGLQKIKGKKYYFKPSNGAMIKSKFKKIKGRKYYFNKKGRMVFGRQLINGRWYTFDRNTGALIG